MKKAVNRKRKHALLENKESAAKAFVVTTILIHLPPSSCNPVYTVDGNFFTKFSSEQKSLQ